MAVNNDNIPTPFPLWTTVSIFVAVLVIGIFLNFSKAINLWASQINPQTLEFYKAVLTVIVALIAAGIAASIQWRQAKTAHNQWRTAHQKLNFELFDRRFAIYTAVRELPSQLEKSSDVVAIRKAYLEIIKPSEWFFNEAIHKRIAYAYMSDIEKEQEPLKVLKASPRFVQDNLYLDTNLKYRMWHHDKQAELKELFTPFLMLDQT